MCLGTSLRSDNGTFISGLAQLAVSFPLSVLVELWFKVTLPGLGWCFLSHATREVSVSEVDRTQTGQLVTSIMVQRTGSVTQALRGQPNLLLAIWKGTLSTD